MSLWEKSLRLIAQVALQGVLGWKWPEIPLCWVPSVCLEQAELQKAPKLQKDRLGHAGATRSALPLTGWDRESGSCLSVHPSELLSLKRGFLPLPLFSSPAPPEQGQYRGCSV